MNSEPTEPVSTKPLTNKERIFCHQYIIDWNGARAARQAGYSEHTAKQIATENLSKPYLKAYIASIRDNLEEEAGISKLMIIKEHQKLAFNSIAHLHNTWIERKEFESLTDDQKTCIASIDTKTIRKNKGTKKKPKTVHVEFVKVKLYDKQKSLEALSKLMGYNDANKINLSGSVNIPVIDWVGGKEPE